MSIDFDSCDIQIVQSEPLDDALFGEGATVVGDKVYQLTWRENQIVEWAVESDDKQGASLKKLHSHDKLTATGMSAGWGLAYNPSDEMLYGTDGGLFIYTFRPDDLSPGEREPFSGL